MRALRFERYGAADVLRVETVADPSPRFGHAVVRVRAAALNPLDWKLRAGHLRLLPTLPGPPRGTGCDFAGEVVALGPGASPLVLGARVLGSVSPFARDGAFAEAIVVPWDRLVAVPDGIDDGTAASLPIAGGTALQALTDAAEVRPGERVLVLGAAGGVGHFAVQIAKHLGAIVTGVCSARNVEFVRALGADEVIDYEREDFGARPSRFDVVFDVAGIAGFGSARRALTPTGRYVSTGGDARAVLGTVVGGLAARITSKQRAMVIRVDPSPALLRRLLDLVAAGGMRAHIDRSIALEEVAEAERAMETGHARGKIVVRPA